MSAEYIRGVCGLAAVCFCRYFQGISTVLTKAQTEDQLHFSLWWQQRMAHCSLARFTV